MSFAIGILLVIATAAIVGYPVLRKASSKDMETGRAVRDSSARREQIRSVMEEIEFDSEIGNTESEQYQELAREYRRRLDGEEGHRE
ncbi:MAG: hypothetical protein FJZ95_00280 [Chloroflexi bacterium]|nr:hypothetical protein [Chloroflexota bacterium]